jgi:hypothetical protein
METGESWETEVSTVLTTRSQRGHHLLWPYVAPEGLVDAPPRSSPDHSVPAHTVCVLQGSDDAGHHLHKPVLGDGVVCPSHVCLWDTREHHGAWPLGPRSQGPAGSAPTTGLQPDSRIMQGVQARETCGPVHSPTRPTVGI